MGVEKKVEVETCVEYALRNKFTGDLAQLCHQDDMENPVLASSISDLMDAGAEWADYGVDDFVAELEEEADESNDYSISNYEIVAREVTTRPLTADEILEYERVKKEALE